MQEIQYRVGDATRPAGTGPKIIAHIVNDQGAWGRGFVLALSKTDRRPEEHYRAWHRTLAFDNGDSIVQFRLGAVQYAAFANGDSAPVWVANMIAQHGVRPDEQAPPAVDYPSLGEALATVATSADLVGASVHMPRIGCGLGGGDWSRVEALIAMTLLEVDVPVTVYDLEQP